MLNNKFIIATVVLGLICTAIPDKIKNIFLILIIMCTVIYAGSGKNCIVNLVYGDSGKIESYTTKCGNSDLEKTIEKFTMEDLKNTAKQAWKKMTKENFEADYIESNSTPEVVDPSKPFITNITHTSDVVENRPVDLAQSLHTNEDTVTPNGEGISSMVPSVGMTSEVDQPSRLAAHDYSDYDPTADNQWEGTVTKTFPQHPTFEDELKRPVNPNDESSYQFNVTSGKDLDMSKKYDKSHSSQGVTHKYDSSEAAYDPFPDEHTSSDRVKQHVSRNLGDYVEKVNKMRRNLRGDHWEKEIEQDLHDEQIPVYSQYGWHFMPPTKWALPHVAPPVCKSYGTRCSPAPVNMSDRTSDLLANVKVLPMDKIDKMYIDEMRQQITETERRRSDKEGRNYVSQPNTVQLERFNDPRKNIQPKSL